MSFTGSASDDDDQTVCLPALGCLELREHPHRGRGVFTQRDIKQGTLIHISPVLIFDQREYSAHGRHTRLDHYTYCWKNGSYALALGLGSMFNHEPFGRQNVGFVRDMGRSLIRYTALKDISAGEELCICYGPNVWFDVVAQDQGAGAGEGEGEGEGEGAKGSGGNASNGQEGAVETGQEQTAEDFLSGFGCM